VDEEEEEIKKKPKRKPTRIYSKHLRDLITKHSPEHTCEKTEAETSCFLRYVTEHIPLFGNRYTDQKLFATQLEQLAQIIQHLIPTTAYVRGYFVDFTNAFRDFLIPKKVDFYKPYTDLIKEHLHAERGRVLAIIKHNDERRMVRLQNGFTEDWDELDHAARELFRRAEEGTTKQYGAASILALELCTGSRKGAFLDPNVQFYTWDEWKTTHRQHNKNEMGINDIGSEEIHLTLKGLSDDKFTSSIIVQVGILKDAKNKIQKHLPEEDRDDPRYLIKPCLVYPAEYLVQKIRDFRKKYSITKETFTTRKLTGNSWGTRLFHPLLAEFFKNSYNLAMHNGWNFGSHHMRRCYVMATIQFFKDSAEMLSGKVLAQSVWMALVLGHMGSVGTTISYSNLKLVVRPQHESFQTPPLELIKQLAKQVFDMQEQIDRLTSRLQERPVQESTSENQYGFVVDGKVVLLDKHSPRQYIDGDKVKTVQHYADLLHNNKIAITNDNLGKLGLGRKLVSDFMKRKKEGLHNSANEVKEQKQEQVQAQVSVDEPPPTEREDAPEQKQPKRQKRQQQTQQQTTATTKTHNTKGYHKLQPNEKVISEKPGSTAAANIHEKISRASLGRRMRRHSYERCTIGTQING